MKGKVYIGSFNIRGEKAPVPRGAMQVNVTSCQSTTHPNRLTFSPMTPVPGGYKGFVCFENYWQSGKRYEDVDVDKQRQWWIKQTKGKRRYPGGRGKKVLHSIFPGFDVPLRYVESRKKVYVPEYYRLIVNRPTLHSIQKWVQQGTDVVVYDLDGPRDETGKPLVLPLTVELLRTKINDPSRPFGHGYIVAGLLCGIEPREYM